MTEPIWLALIGGGFGLLTAIATGIAAGLVRVVNLLLTQSQDTIRTLQTDRDYWRNRALGEAGTQEADE